MRLMSDGDRRRATGDADGRAALRLRADALNSIRRFFAARGFLEVDTPLLVPAPGSESSLEPVQVIDGSSAAGWLVTSPEHGMKRLLAGGEERIFQVCRCFRGGERTRHHRVEFTMIEWYRRAEDYRQIAADVEELVAQVAEECLGRREVADAQGRTVDLSLPWERITVAESIEKYAGLSLSAPDSQTHFAHAARAAGIGSVTPSDDWETVFYKILVERVEPGLALEGRGVHLLDWPRPMAALARLKQSDPSVAERVESYAAGLELANGFSELTDPREQRRRFRTEREVRRRQGASILPVDEAFLRALAEGMPAAAGVALGLDRLLLLLSPHHDLRHVAPHFMEPRERE